MYDLYEGMLEVSEPRETRDDVVEYYKWKYGTDPKQWGTPLARDLQQYTKNKKGVPMEVRNIRRRFERRGGVDPLSKAVKSKQQVAEYKALGETLPPKPPKGGYLVSGVICVHYADDECEPRYLRKEAVGLRKPSAVRITGNDAMKFAEDPQMQGIVNLYMGIPYDEVKKIEIKACDGGEEGECEPDLLIEPIEEGVTPFEGNQEEEEEEEEEE